MIIQELNQFIESYIIKSVKSQYVQRIYSVRNQGYFNFSYRPNSGGIKEI